MPPQIELSIIPPLNQQDVIALNAVSKTKPSPWSGVPSLTNVLDALKRFKIGKEALRYGLIFQDQDLQFSASVIMTSAPFSFFNALLNLIIYIPTFFHEIKIPLINKIGTTAGLLGIILCGIETILEGYELFKLHQFEKEPFFHYSLLRQLTNAKSCNSKLLVKIKNQYVKDTDQLRKIIGETEFDPLNSEFENAHSELALHPTDLNKLLKFKASLLKIYLTYLIRRFGENPIIDNKELEKIFPEEKFSLEERQAYYPAYLALKKAKLAKSIRRWFVLELFDNHDSTMNIDKLLNNLSKSNCLEQHVTAAEALFHNIDIQHLKKRIIHITGILALSITLTGLSLTLAGFPIAAMIVVLLGFLFSTTRFSLTKGWLKQTGWEFYPSLIIPKCIRTRARKIHQKVKSLFQVKKQILPQ